MDARRSSTTRPASESPRRKETAGSGEALWRFGREGSCNREQFSPDFYFGGPDAGGSSLNSET